MVLQGLPLMLWWSLAWFPYFYSDGHGHAVDKLNKETKITIYKLKKINI